MGWVQVEVPSAVVRLVPVPELFRLSSNLQHPLFIDLSHSQNLRTSENHLRHTISLPAPPQRLTHQAPVQQRRGRSSDI